MTPAQLAHYEAGRCWCCLTPTDDIALDPDTGLCLYCQPCPSCGSYNGTIGSPAVCADCGALDQS